MEDKFQYDVIQLMKDLKRSHEDNTVRDVLYLDKIRYTEHMKDQFYTAEKDIFLIIEEKDGVLTYRFYDENKDLIAIDFEDDGRDIMAVGEFFKNREVEETQSILESISHLNKEEALSLAEVETELETYAKALGIPKEKILSSSTLPVEQEINDSEKEKEMTDDDKIHLDQEDSETSKEANQAILEHIPSKSEVDLDKKVTGKQTLGQILGVPTGGKLIAVYSDHIVDNTNTAEFSFLIQTPDGTLEPASMLEQVNGNHPDKDIASVNRDGSEVKEQQVNSLFSIESTGNTQDMLSIKRGHLGILELSYVQMDPTDNTRGMSIPLETDHVYPVTSEVRNEMNQEKGKDNITDNLDEMDIHQEANCDDITIKEANGIEEDGHQHLTNEEAVIDSYINEIMDNRIIDDNYYFKEVKKAFIEIAEKHPKWSLEEVKEYVAYDLEKAAPIQERY